MNPKSVWKLEIQRSDPDLGYKERDEIELPEAKAIELIANGQAWFAEKPEVPPSALLHQLQTKVKLIEQLGPKLENSSQFAELNEKLFPHHVRQTFVDDCSVYWVRGKVGLRDLVGRRLSQWDSDEFDLFALLRLIAFASIPRWRGNQNDLQHHLHTHEYNRCHPGEREDYIPLIGFLSMTEDWVDFAYEAECLSADFEDAIRQGLAAGRILVSQETPMGDRFVHPNVASRMSVRDIDDSYCFALSSELPSSVFKKMPPLHARRKEAASWAGEAVAHFGGLNLRVTGTTAKTVMQLIFGLTANASKDAWKLANSTESKFENPKYSSKASHEQIIAHAKYRTQK